MSLKYPLAIICCVFAVSVASCSGDDGETPDCTKSSDGCPGHSWSGSGGGALPEGGGGTTPGTGSSNGGGGENPGGGGGNPGGGGGNLGGGGSGSGPIGGGGSY